MFGSLFCSHLWSLWLCLPVVADLANPVSPKGDSAHCANCPRHIDQQPQHRWPTDKPAFLEPAGTNLSFLTPVLLKSCACLNVFKKVFCGEWMAWTELL